MRPNRFIEPPAKRKITLLTALLYYRTAELKGMHHAVVTVSVANLRSRPGHPAEFPHRPHWVRPCVFGKAQRGWYYVQTPDHYLAWVDGGGI